MNKYRVGLLGLSTYFYPLNFESNALIERSVAIYLFLLAADENIPKMRRTVSSVALHCCQILPPVVSVLSHNHPANVVVKRAVAWASATLFQNMFVYVFCVFEIVMFLICVEKRFREGP